VRTFRRETTGSILRRRVVSIPLYTVFWALFTAGLPLLLLLTGTVDLASKQWRIWPRTRCILFFTLYLNCEMLGMLVGLGIWLFSGAVLGIGIERRNAWMAVLQRWWSKWLFYGATWLFSISSEVEGDDCIEPGPIVLMLRHASSADTPIGQIFVTNPHKILLRWVIKKELLWDPCLDIGGNWLPNVFVDRKSSNRDGEIQAIRELSRGLGPRDGVLIYPEGTRFTLKKLEAARKQLKESGKAWLYEKAMKMRAVLPPRPSGVVAIMEEAPEADVVFCAHTGFDGAIKFYEYLEGALVGATLHIKFWRVKASEIPKELDARMDWLYDQWLKIDEWIICKREAVTPR
jgi:1-acyl-sn-glycerol-3-phosphate acyltransferase